MAPVCRGLNDQDLLMLWGNAGVGLLESSVQITSCRDTKIEEQEHELQNLNSAVAAKDLSLAHGSPGFRKHRLISIMNQRHSNGDLVFAMG